MAKLCRKLHRCTWNFEPSKESFSNDSSRQQMDNSSFSRKVASSVKYNTNIIRIFFSFRDQRSPRAIFRNSFYNPLKGLMTRVLPSNAFPTRYFSGKETESFSYGADVGLDNSVQSFVKFSFVVRIVRRPVTSSSVLEPRNSRWNN